MVVSSLAEDVAAAIDGPGDEARGPPAGAPRDPPSRPELGFRLLRDRPRRVVSPSLRRWAVRPFL